jgi:hypothetical protein
MIQTPNLQTILTLTGGTSPVPRSVFVWGTPGGAFSVGTHGDWIVNAAGVAPVHFFLRFDGKMLHLAGGPAGAPLSISGRPVDQTWRPLPVFSVVAFGAAQLRVTCEPAVPRVPSPPPTAPVIHVAPRVPDPPARLESTVPLGEVRRVRTEPIVLPEAAQRAWAHRSDPPVHQSNPPIFGTAPSYPPAGEPHPGATLVSAAGPQTTMSEVPSVRRELPQSSPELESTLSDAGALKAHAERVASEPNLAWKSADAYLEAVRHQGGVHGSTPPPQGDAFGPGAVGNVGGVSAMPPPSALPPGVAGPNVISSEPNDASKPKAPKQKPSWVMLVTLILLPFAGYFAIFWEPSADAPPPPQVSATTPTASSPVAARTEAPSATAPSATGGPAASASAVRVATAAPASASGEGAASSRAPPAGASSVAVVTVPTNANRQRDALNAAFEGRLNEALAHYEALATGPDAQVYSTAARLIRERAFRKP